MPEILVIRHAKASGNADGILMGSSNVFDGGLTKEGKQAAKIKALELRDKQFIPDLVFCSELKRTNQTAQIFIDELMLNLIKQPLADLNERSFGQYEGLPYAAVLSAFQEYGNSPPTIEEVEEFIARVLNGLNYIKGQTFNKCLIVTHSNPLAVIRCSINYPDKINEFRNYETDNYLEGFTI